MNEFVQELLKGLLPILASLLGTVITILVGMAVKALKAKFEQDQVRQEALDAILAGVSVTYEEFVRGAKRAAEDGKLSEEERKKALQLAKARAMSLASGPVKAMLLSFSAEYFDALINKTVGELKQPKQTSVISIEPSPTEPILETPQPAT